MENNFPDSLSYLRCYSVSMSIGYLYLLTWYPCISSMITVKGWDSLTGEEDRCALRTIPSGLRATLYFHPARPPTKRLQFFYNIILSPSSAPTLLLLSIRLQLFPPISSPLSATTFPGLIPMIYIGWSYLIISRIGVLTASAPPPNTSP